MGTLWLYAISVEEVRGIFGAGEDEAAALRAVAAGRFGRPAPQHGLLGKLGPLFARPLDAPVIRPDSPNQEDCERLLSGQHVPPSRLAASWRLLGAWLEHRAWSSHSATVDEHSLNAIEFDLGRAEVPAKYGVRALMGHDLEIAMRTAPAMLAGYSPGNQAAAAGRAWHEALPILETESQAWIGDLAGWLGGFGEWTSAAEAARRPRPDLVCVWWAE